MTHAHYAYYADLARHLLDTVPALRYCDLYTTELSELPATPAVVIEYETQAATEADHDGHLLRGTLRLYHHHQVTGYHTAFTDNHTPQVPPHYQLNTELIAATLTLDVSYASPLRLSALATDHAPDGYTVDVAEYELELLLPAPDYGDGTTAELRVATVEGRVG